ncbi:hypothetical protein ACHAQJ_004817 [Trichoderma viride]
MANIQRKLTSHGPNPNSRGPCGDYSRTHLTTKRPDGDLSNSEGLLSTCRPRTTTRTVDSSGDSPSAVHNQGLASPERKTPTRYYKKRRRIEDEDELALPGERNRIRTSPVSEIKDWETENWPAAIVRKQAVSDPEFIRHLLDAAGPKIWALLMEQAISDPNFLRGSLDSGSSKAKRVGTLESEIKKEKEIHQQKEKSYNILRSKFADLEIDRNSALMANKAADDTIKGAWKQLDYNIKNFVSNYLTERPQNEMSILNETRCDQHAKSMTPIEETVHLRDNHLRRHLWQIIYLYIFSGSSKNWYGEIGHALAHHIGQQVDPHSLPNLQSLKMISAIKSVYDPALEKKQEVDGDAELQELVWRTVAGLQHFVPTNIVNLLEVDLKTILSEAVKIHTTMMKSKAIFIVQWIGEDDGKSIPYDSETMEFHQGGIDVDATDHAVHLVESPAVWKIGNADGENLDSSMVFLKSSVVLEEMKTTITVNDKHTSGGGKDWGVIMRS